MSTVSIKHKISKRYNGSNRHNLPTRKNRPLKSTITKAHPKSFSVRTTIPHDITDILGWIDGDILAWVVEKHGDKFVVTVRRLE